MFILHINIINQGHAQLDIFFCQYSQILLHFLNWLALLQLIFDVDLHCRNGMHSVHKLKIKLKYLYIITLNLDEWQDKQVFKFDKLKLFNSHFQGSEGLIFFFFTFSL